MKTVHGAEFYASKKYKGGASDNQGDKSSDANNRMLHEQSMNENTNLSIFNQPQIKSEPSPLNVTSTGSPGSHKGDSPADGGMNYGAPDTNTLTFTTQAAFSPSEVGGGGFFSPRSVGGSSVGSAALSELETTDDEILVIFQQNTNNSPKPFHTFVFYSFHQRQAQVV